MADEATATVDDLRQQVKRSHGIRVTDLVEIQAAAAEDGGKLVGVTGLDDDGDWCGNGRFRFKWPPRRGLGPFIEAIVSRGIGGTILINGITNPEEVIIDIGRGPAR